MVRLVSVCVAFMFALSVNAQEITGKIVDTNGQPIDAVSVILQKMDSTYIASTLTDANGIFKVEIQKMPCRIIFQHIVYQTKLVIVSNVNIGTVILDENTNKLKEVVVKGERPFVKAENGKLSYDLSLLASKRIVNNAYEALAELPGVRDNNGTLTLAGSSTVTVMINGKPSTMTAEQLTSLLRNTPIDRVKKAEVIYSAPPEYHIRGSVINVEMRQPDKYSFQGEVNTQYTNQFFNSGKVGTNFRFSTPKSSFDIIASADDAKNYAYIDMFSRHTLNGKVYDISQIQQLRNKGWDYFLYGAWNYNINKNSNFSVAYTTSISPSDNSTSHTVGNFQEGEVLKNGDERMHNITLAYKSNFGLVLGADYTYFNTSNNQRLNTKYSDNSTQSLSMNGAQRINKLSVYADQTHSFEKGWNIGYGVSYAYTYDKDYQQYTLVSGDFDTQNTNIRLKEQIANMYFKFGKDFDSGSSFSVSATGENYKQGSSNHFNIFPQASFLYVISPKQMLQLSLSSNKTYPSYWQMQSSVSYLDGYAEVHGTPGLKPMSSYELIGTYILNQKYQLSLFFNYIPHYFQQAAYQSTQRLALIYQTKNWDYMQNWGVQMVVPFKIGDWFNSNLTMIFFNLKEKCDDYFDIPFNRNKWTASVSLDNTFKVCKGIALSLNTGYQSPMIQGTYNLESLFPTDLGAKWTFAKGNATLTAKCNDLFNTSLPKATIRYMGQYLDMDKGFYTRCATINFVYRFGGYKSKERKKVDTSRFGH